MDNIRPAVRKARHKVELKGTVYFFIIYIYTVYIFLLYSFYYTARATATAL